VRALRRTHLNQLILVAAVLAVTMPAVPLASGLVSHALATQSNQQTAAPDSNLPEVSAFTAQVRARLRSDRALQAQYTFMERREEIDVSKLGKVKEGPVKVYEVYPSEEPGNLWKRLMSVNGKPLSAAELAKNDAVHQKDIFARLNESPAQKAKRAREAAKERAEEKRGIDEIFAAYEITLVRREVVNGYPTVLASLEPRKAFKARTDEGKMMKKIRARAWIHETEHQIVRVEIEALEDIGFGMGVVGKLYKGTVGEFVRTKVNGEVWLPARARFTAKGRALFRKFAIDSVTEWWDYKKFSVSTTEVTR
jgi:hypothetical protein